MWEFLQNSHVIIGGGPVGLCIAITILKLSEKSDRNGLLGEDEFKEKVYIFEKRDKYKRDYIMVLSSNTLDFFPKEVSQNIKKKYGCFVRAPWRDQQGRCYSNETYGWRVSIPIKSLEKELLRYLQKNYLKQFEIIYKNINEKDLDSILMSECINIFACDGVNSVVKKWLKVPTISEKIGNGLVLTFKPEKHLKIRKDLKKLKKAGINIDKDMSVNQHRYRFFRSRRSNDKYYLAIQLMDKENNLIVNEEGFIKDLHPSTKKIIKNASKFYGFNFKNFNKVRYNKLGIYNNHIKDFEFKINLDGNLYWKKIGRLDFYEMNKRNLVDIPTVYIMGDSLMSSSFFAGSNFNIAIQCIQIIILPQYDKGPFVNIVDNFVGQKSQEKIDEIIKYLIEELWVTLSENTKQTSFNHEDLLKAGHTNFTYDRTFSFQIDQDQESYEKCLAEVVDVPDILSNTFFGDIDRSEYCHLISRQKFRS